MDTTLGAEQKYALITRRLEIQNGWCAQKLQSLVTEDKPIRYQWVTAPTGKPHIGYFIPLIKFADFIRAGGEVVVEFTDSYAFLVNYKFPWDQVQQRKLYYRRLITAVLQAVGVPMAKVSMVEASSYQGNDQFIVDFWKLCALCSQQDTKETGAEVGASTMLGPLLTPLLQELGEEYLNVDVQFGGTDQRGIFNLGEQFLPELGYKKRVHVMNELLPSLTGGKMSSSHPAHTKIMFLDDPEAVAAKIAGASCPAQVVQGNGVLPILEHILFPISEIRMLQLQNGSLNGVEDHSTNGHPTNGERNSRPFVADGAPEGALFSVAVAESECMCGSKRHYRTYIDLEQDYVQGRVGPAELKEAVISALNQLLATIRKSYSSDEGWQSADQMGYPEDCVARRQ